MAFVNLGGDESTKPSYFEVIAAEKMVPGIKNAIIYALSVFSQRHDWAQNILRYEDEILSLVMLGLDGLSIRSSNATFAQSFYGIKIKSPTGKARLSKNEKLKVLVIYVLLPYIRLKLDKLYQHQVGSGVLGLALQHRSSFLNRNSPSPTLTERCLISISRGFIKAYPYIIAAYEASSFAYQLLYLLDLSPCHDPLYATQGFEVARTTSEEMMAAAMAQNSSRSRQVQILCEGRHPMASRIIRALATGAFTVADHARSSIFVAAFAFKALEWWYSAGEEKLTSRNALVARPPPPPPIPQSAEGVGLPSDPSSCPLCKGHCKNPSFLTTSGYVFCYACVFNYVMECRRCPVTHLPTSLDHIRKIYRV
mmetsp:Transcript_21017/g.37521  ORF Transcript_21017/g.37521 Transcript_21017/m.37521 type:complete len:366 (-) Transcript_21017:533-1630(-)